jgi:hypothetical protein
MKLSTDTIHLLDKLVATSLVAGLKKLIIEKDKIRGIDEKQSVVIISTDNVPDFDGKNVGINRIDMLSARMNLVKGEGDMLIEATESANKQDISLLEINVGKTKAQFRCASVEAVKGVPKNITDTIVWQLNVDAKLLPVLNQAVSAMGAETITIASRDGKTVSFECVDATKDVFTTDAEEAPMWIGNKATPSTSFCQKFPAKTLLGLLKEASKASDPVPVKMGEQGILSLTVNGFSFFVIPTQ